MALSYANLFADLGKLVKHYDLARTDAADVSTDISEIITRFQTSGVLDPIAGIAGTRSAWRGQHTARRQALAQYAQNRLLDPESILDELFWSGGSIGEGLRLLRIAMRAASESINASVVTLGSVSAAAGNHGATAVLMTTKRLDGYSSPGSVSGAQIAAQTDYAGLDSELCVPSDTLTVECVADSQRDGRREGGENFQVYGSQADSLHGVDEEGFGTGGSFQGLSAYTLLTNGDFESGSGNTPAGWTVVAGTPGSHIFLSGTRYHGAQSLKLTASGSPATIQLSQVLTAGAFQRLRLYCLAFRYMGEAGIASGDLSIHLADGSGTIDAPVVVTAASLAAATSWAHAYGFVLMPDYVQTTLTAHIEWATNPTVNKSIWIDDICLGPVAYLGGLGLAWRRGEEFDAALRGDRWNFTVANSEGVFQRFFRRAFGVQMPSNNAGAETRADSLAT